jgi:hypothetical protein
MASIPATNPVTVPATGSVTYNFWFLTQLITKVSPDKAPITVHLTRAAQDAQGNWTLMPRASGSEISFTLDMWNEMANDPTIGPLISAAMDSITAAVVAYGQSKNLL